MMPANGIDLESFLHQEMRNLPQWRTDNIAATAAKIAIENFEWRHFTLLFFNATLLYSMSNFLNFYDKSVIISRGLNKPDYAQAVKQYVIFGKDVEDITSMLDWMREYQFDNTGKYIFICESENGCDETEAVKTFWYHKITNVVFLKHDEDNVNSYTYFFTENICAMGDPVKMENMEICSHHVNRCEIFPEKFKDLHRCSLIASTFEQPPYMKINDGRPTGSDGELLVLLAEALNATLQIMTPQRGDGWGALNSEGGWVGSLGDVYYDLANISMTSAALTLNRFSYFQQSLNYNFVIIGWITSPTELQPSSLKLLHPFHVKTHIAVGVTFACVILCALIISSKLWNRLTTNVGVSQRSNNIILYSWMFCMGLPAHRLPRKPFLLYVTFLWIWYTFFVRTMYQASLINSMKSNMYASNVQSIEEVMAANYKFGGGTALRDYYINYPKVYNNFIGMNASELVRIAKRVANGEKWALSVNLEAVNTFYKSDPPLHILRQRIVVSPTAIYFKKFSPLANSINKILRRLMEAGFSDAMYRKYVTPHQRAPMRENNKEPMSTEHYTGCYALLLAGLCTSVLCFICEVYFKIKNKNYFEEDLI